MTPAVQPQRVATQWTRSMKLNYTTPELIFHWIDVGATCSLIVFGGDGEGAYEWAIVKDGAVEQHSDAGYGMCDIALRDGLIALHGLPPVYGYFMTKIAPKTEPSIGPASSASETGQGFYCQAGGCESQCINCADEAPGLTTTKPDPQWSERLGHSGDKGDTATPRTDALVKEIEGKWQVPLWEGEQRFANLARQLERELAEAQLGLALHKNAASQLAQMAVDAVPESSPSAVPTSFADHLRANGAAEIPLDKQPAHLQQLLASASSTVAPIKSAHVYQSSLGPRTAIRYADDTEDDRPATPLEAALTRSARGQRYGFEKAHAVCILLCRDALLRKDYQDAWHWLYVLDSKQVPHDPFKPWGELEALAGTDYENSEERSLYVSAEVCPADRDAEAK